MLTLEDAYMLINNLDYTESKRKFAPKWSTVAVDKNGHVIDIIRYKEQPNDILNKMHMDKHPDTVQFTAWPGRFTEIADLQEAIRECMSIHKNY